MCPHTTNRHVAAGVSKEMLLVLFILFLLHFSLDETNPYFHLITYLSENIRCQVSPGVEMFDAFLYAEAS